VSKIARSIYVRSVLFGFYSLYLTECCVACYGCYGPDINRGGDKDDVDGQE